VFIETNGIEIEDRVRDRITGLEGTVVSIHAYVTGCARASVQPPAVDGKVPEALGCDVLTLEVLEPDPRHHAPVEPATVGGPRDDPHSRV
jgi:hypothetical protein